MKPYAASCDDNKEVIFNIISSYLKTKNKLLEIASGTGQHGVYFAKKLPHLLWQTSDLSNNLKGIKQWQEEAQLDNLLEPIELDVSAHWPSSQYDALFSANALHIMSEQHVEDCFIGLGKVLNSSAVCLFYGPFNYNGDYTSDSNKRFDVWLKNNNMLSGIKNFETVCALAKKQGLELEKDHEMPANNRLLVFKKS